MLLTRVVAVHVSQSAGVLGGSEHSSTRANAAAGAAAEVNTNAYMERLKVLRARCGLENQGGADPLTGLGRPMSTGSLGQSSSAYTPNIYHLMHFKQTTAP